jgi:2-polyprenyl-6-methoxyphenol hydroxylase-like FAD-dependent oxidoreductase
MSRRIDTEVLVVGGGPVGLSLAMDLARRRVRVTVAETRAPAEPPSARCNHVREALQCATKALVSSG